MFLLSCGTANRSEKENQFRPNIILIMADDLGYETISANGGQSYSTPEIDQMAASGLRFNHCYAQPLCTPSRVQIMTGIYNVRNYVRFGLLEKNQTTFGHLFQRAGYATCAVGKWQLGKEANSPQLAGFDQHCLWQVQKGRVDSSGRDTRFSGPVLEVNGHLNRYASDEYGPDIVSNFGLDFIEKSHQEGKPFLLYYPMILTHCPFSPTPDSPHWKKNDTAVQTYKGDPSYFADMVAYTDKIVGRFIQKVEELGIRENTVIIFTGDNGTDRPIVSKLNGREVAGAKNQSTDAGTRVPLIVQWPGVISPNSVTDQLVDFSDFLPSLCEIANIELTDSLDLDGRSFVPLLKGDTSRHREWIYSWYSRSGDVDKARVFARNQRYKLYESGEFYEIPKDYTEQNPLSLGNLDTEAKKTYTMLQSVLDHYQGQRLNKVSSLGQE